MDTTQKLYDTIVVGGGIRGLSAAYFYKKKGHSVLLLEKTERLGGWIRSDYIDGFLIERGPRTLKPARHTLKLIADLGLSSEIIWIGPQKRYILQEKGLVEVTPRLLLKALLPLSKELFMRPQQRAEETIESFSLRHFGPWVTDNLIDPLTLGIYGGSIKRLSVDKAFPLLKKYEREKGSVLRGLLFAKRSPYPPLFSLKGGMQTLTDGLAKALEGSCLTDTPVMGLEKEEHWTIRTPHKSYHAKNLIKALPGEEERLSLDLVTLCYDSQVLHKKGFGFLVPSRLGLSLLGICFDSDILNEPRTRLTLMMRPSNEEEAKKAALTYAGSLLGITKKPLVISYFHAPDAICQYTLGLQDPPPVGVNDAIFSEI